MKISIRLAAASFLATASIVTCQPKAEAQLSNRESCNYFNYMVTEDGACVDLTHLTPGGQINDSGSPIVGRFLVALQKLGIPVAFEDCEPGLYGTYSPGRNSMSICENNVEGNEAEYIATLAHESWHVVQDYVDGLDNASTTPVTLGDGNYKNFENMVRGLDLDTLDTILSGYDGEDQPFEVEAFFMEDSPLTVVEILEDLANM